MSEAARSVRTVARGRTVFGCEACGQRSSQWAGRCPACGGWGTIQQLSAVEAGSARVVVGVPSVPLLGSEAEADRRVPTGSAGLDRVLGGGLVPSSVTLLAGAPGIGKSTLLLQLLARLSAAGLSCLLVSGEESHPQVAARARRIGLAADSVTFAPGRELDQVLATARAEDPFLLAVDSIQALRDTSGTQTPGGVSQVRTCTDALVGLAKTESVAVVMTGHVTKDGDLAGPRALEHAVDVVLGFEGDLRSGLRVLTGGKNRFGAEGESAWFEIGGDGLHEIDPTSILISGERAAGAATALAQAGRRALAIEVQALVGATEGPARRQATGIDLRRFQLVAAVLDRAAGLPIGRAELFGASSGGVRIDDPACDLAIAAALASASMSVPPPADAAFVGEVALTGIVRPATAMIQRLAAARAAGCTTIFAAGADGDHDGVRIVPVRHVHDALGWALRPAERGVTRRSA